MLNKKSIISCAGIVSAAVLVPQWLHAGFTLGSNINLNLTNYGLALNTFDYKFADLDGDNRPELVVYATYKTSSLYTNWLIVHKGTHQNINFLAGFASWVGVAVADLDNDGRPDIVTSLVNGNQPLDTFIRVYKNNSGLSFAQIDARTGTTNINTPFKYLPYLVDLDSDGDTDILIGTNMCINNGSGIFPSAGSMGLFATGVTDHNRDGFPDLVAGINGQALVSYRTGGSYSDGPPYDDTRLVFADMNNDGIPDPIGTNYFINQTNQGLVPEDIGDLNGDGYLDIVLSGKVYLNQGGKNFTNVFNAPYTGKTQVIDFDSDGDLDLAVKSSKGVDVFFNDLINGQALTPVNRLDPPAFRFPSDGYFAIMDRGDTINMRFDYGGYWDNRACGNSFEIAAGTNFGGVQLINDQSGYSGTGVTRGRFVGTNGIFTYRPSLDGPQYFRIRAVNQAFRKGSWSPDRQFTVLFRPQITNVTATNRSLTIRYIDNSNGEDRFDIYRAPAGGNYEKVGEAPANSTQYLDSVSSTGFYSYEVRAIHNRYGTNAASMPYSVRAGYDKPIFVSNKVGVNPRDIYLYWNINTDVTAWQLERSPDGSSWTELFPGGTNGTNYISTEPMDQPRYYYRLKAYYGAEITVGDALLADFTTGQVVQEIREIKAYGYRNGIQLEWQRGTYGESNITVLRSTDGVNFSDLTNLAPGLSSWFDADTLEHRWYFYRVEARNSAGAFAASTAVSNFTGNNPLKITSVQPIDQGRGFWQFRFAYTDQDADIPTEAAVWYTTNLADYLPGKVTGNTNFYPGADASVIWNSMADLNYNGRAWVRLSVFDGFEWSTTEPQELTLSTGAQDNLSEAVVPEVVSDVGISFQRLPQGAVVSIYTIRGFLVRRATAGADGLFNWDLLDQAGVRARVGYYIVVLELPGRVVRRTIFIAR